MHINLKYPFEIKWFFYLKFVNCMRKLVIKVECYCLIVLFNEKYTQVYINHANLTRNFNELKTIYTKKIFTHGILVSIIYI